MYFCKRKDCGWNTTYTSGFHPVWMQNKYSFTLPMTHNFLVKTGTTSKPSQKGEPATYDSTYGSSLTSYIVQTGALSGMVTANKDSTKAVLENYKINAAESDMSALMADLHHSWGLNYYGIYYFTVIFTPLLSFQYSFKQQH